MLMEYEGAAELTDAAARMSSELSPVRVASVLAGLAIRYDEVDTAFCEPLAPRIGVVGAVRDGGLWLLPGTAFGSRNFDFDLRKCNSDRHFPAELPKEDGQRCARQRLPGVEQHVLLFPLLQSSPASRRSRILDQTTSLMQ
jgi:hypothetical protein